MANVAKDFAQLISQSKSNKTGPYDTQATVKRVEGNTVWVSIPGGIDETPIDKTVNCTAGDKVQVRVSGGRAWITGNASAPPTDDTTAIKARTTANEAQVLAVDAKETADAVEGIAEGVNEHFWHDNTGAHVTEVTQEEWNEPADPNYHSGGNTLITTQGMAIRSGLVNLAEFGATGARVGRVDTDDSIEIANNAIKFCHEGLSYASIEKVSGTRFIDDSTSNRLHFDSTGIHLFDSQGNGLTVSNGDVTISGSITAEGHDSPIGYRPTRATGSYSLASGTSWTTVPSSGLARTTLSQGVWIIQAQAIFASNSTGWRALRIYDVTTSENIGRSGVTQPAVNGATTNLTTMAIISLTASNAFTLQITQNSGAARNVDLTFDAVRIA